MGILDNYAITREKLNSQKQHEETKQGIHDNENIAPEQDNTKKEFHDNGKLKSEIGFDTFESSYENEKGEIIETKENLPILEKYYNEEEELISKKKYNYEKDNEKYYLEKITEKTYKDNGSYYIEEYEKSQSFYENGNIKQDIEYEVGYVERPLYESIGEVFPGNLPKKETNYNELGEKTSEKIKEYDRDENGDLLKKSTEKVYGNEKTQKETNYNEYGKINEGFINENGEKTGLWKVFNSNGLIKEEKTYDNGTLESTEYFDGKPNCERIKLTPEQEEKLDKARLNPNYKYVSIEKDNSKGIER